MSLSLVFTNTNRYAYTRAHTHIHTCVYVCTAILDLRVTQYSHSGCWITAVVMLQGIKQPIFSIERYLLHVQKSLFPRNRKSIPNDQQALTRVSTNNRIQPHKHSHTRTHTHIHTHTHTRTNTYAYTQAHTHSHTHSHTHTRIHTHTHTNTPTRG